MKIIVGGGTGFIGMRLVERLLEEGHSVVVLSRKTGKMPARHHHLNLEGWDAKNPGSWEKHIEGAGAVINLTGELIAGKRWTERQKSLILNSRVDSTTAFVEAMRRSSKRPAVLINVSGVGFYGDVPSGDVTEAFPNGEDFLAGVCRQWEEAALKAAGFGVRVVTPRLGVVLGPQGGALPRLELPFKLFAGGYLGTGKQWFPWIHRDDLVDAILFILGHPQLSGAVNFTAPDAVTMKSFCAVLGKVMHRPSWSAVPAFALRLGLGEMAEMLLTGQKAIPKKLAEAGFAFTYPSLDQALTSILGRNA